MEGYESMNVMQSELLKGLSLIGFESMKHALSN